MNADLRIIDRPRYEEYRLAVRAGAVGGLGVNSAMRDLDLDLVLVPGLAAESEENCAFL